jgi:hypothetical protein
LTTSRCESAENNLRIVNNLPQNGQKKEFAVCTKYVAFDTHEYGVKFIEWIHLLRILGVDKTFVYVKSALPEIMKLFKYFEEKEMTENFMYLHPSENSNTKADTSEDMAYQTLVINDCFHRNRNLYKYIAIIDQDEVMIPLKEGDISWHDMMKSIGKSDDGHYFQMGLFLDTGEKKIEGIPEYAYMLQHVKVSLTRKKMQTFSRKSNFPSITFSIHFSNKSFSGNRMEKALLKPQTSKLPRITARISVETNAR